MANERKLAVFDLDSTLLEGESMEALAKAHGNPGRMREINRESGRKGMTRRNLSQRAALLKKMSLGEVAKVGRNLSVRKGVGEMLKELKSRGYTLALVSGSFDVPFRHLARQNPEFALFDHVYLNRLGINRGKNRVSGKVSVRVKNNKGEILRKLQRKLQVKSGNILAVGDAHSDVGMFSRAGISIAIGNATESAIKAANHHISGNDMHEIIKILDLRNGTK
ncbi:MAG: HAD-IB family phosphatase [Candidatus Micrarchaeota archaeon]